MAGIGVRNLHKRFGEFVAVHDSSFTIDGGEFFVMLGPSGCGKTTTLRMIAGLELPTSGQILIDGEDVTFVRAARRDIAFMFQLFALYPHMKVFDNIAFPLKCHGVPRRERRRRVEETAALLRIEHFLHRRVSGLAGGDRQRVALGRAIVRKPKAFLMDEPLGALDAEMRELMCDELRTLHDRLKATTLYVTHDQLEAMSMADRIIVMNHGVIEQIGTPQEIYDQPRTMFVADFIGSPSMSFLYFDGVVEAGQSSVTIDGVAIEVPELHESCAHGALALGVRPEQVRFSDTSALRGEVFGTEYLGTTQIVTVETGHGPIRARMPSHQRARTWGSSAVPTAWWCSMRATDVLSTVRCTGGVRVAELSLRGVHKRFGEESAVAGVDLDVADGELVVLLGPTGAGKTTTLRLIAGLEKPDEGEIRIGGRVMTGKPPAARDLAFVFQQYSLYPHMTAYDNLAFPLRAPGRRVEERLIREKILEVAGLLHIDHKLDSKATQLSGGEMQRVAIGRALVRDPAAFLMDEPLSSLDAKLRSELRLELKRIHRDLGATIVYVTHDQIEAMTMADRIGVLREGRLVQVGASRTIYEAPRNVYVASRLGSPAMNLLPGDLLPAEGKPAGTVTVGARTEHLHIEHAQGGNGMGTVQRIEHLGDRNHLHLAVGEHALITLADPASTLRAGDRIDIQLRNPLFFDRDGERIALGAAQEHYRT